MTSASSRKLTRAVRNLPYSMRPDPSETLSASKFGSPKMAATTGRMTSSTSDWTTVANAAPIAMPIARSTRFPANANVLNSVNNARTVLPGSVRGVPRGGVQSHESARKARMKGHCTPSSGQGRRRVEGPVVARVTASEVALR